jgi:hypothetical protein
VIEEGGKCSWITRVTVTDPSHHILLRIICSG